jgi:hypothetical protein
MTEINKKSREKIVEIYKDTKAKLGKTDLPSEKRYYRGVLNALAEIAMEFGFNAADGKIFDEEMRHIDEKLLREFDITDEQLERWGFDVPDDDDDDEEDGEDYHAEDNAEYNAMKSEEAHYINSRR